MIPPDAAAVEFVIALVPVDGSQRTSVPVSAGKAGAVDLLGAVERVGGRLAIVLRLAAGETRVVDLTGRLGLAQSTVSAHVACLRACGLLIGRPQGRQMFYSLTRPELLDLLVAAQTLLAATGSAVAVVPELRCRCRGC